MTRVRTFQILVAAATACYVVWFLLPHWSGYLTELEQKVAGYSGYGAVLPVQHPLYSGVWLALWLIAAVGLALLQNWARHLFSLSRSSVPFWLPSAALSSSHRSTLSLRAPICCWTVRY